ncbi:hypothetical protein PINS_up024201 [Pythium insidiosum]|nr:hypothetical protein PINS_up024201 [Pythium insidiosum]
MSFRRRFVGTERKTRSFSLAWFVNVTLLRSELRAIPVSEWSYDSINPLLRQAHRPRENAVVLSRTKELILAALTQTRGNVDACSDRSPVTTAIVASVLHEPERDDVLELLTLHLQRIQDDLESMKDDISRVLGVVIKRLRLDATLDDSTEREKRSSLNEPVVIPGPAPQTWMADLMLPTFSSLKQAFDLQVDALASIPDDEKDWHPNTNQQVLDLVHPSLYCCAFGVTQRVAADDAVATTTFATPAEQMHALLTTSSSSSALQTATAATTEGIRFQWLPSDVEVSSDGSSANFLTYINNLHPETHAPLYETLGEVFARFVPLFERVLSTLNQSTALDRWMHECDVTTMCPPQLLPPGLLYDAATEPTHTLLRGKTCQVIVKIAEIRLTPERPEYAGGSWHVEATNEERIIATGLCYAACENITESRLSFRVMVQEPDDEESTDLSTALELGLLNGGALMQSLGSVTAVEGRGVVFPNIFQHRVEPFRLADPTKPGVRRLLAFFLVDPSTRVPSTAVTPPQQQQWIERALEHQLRALELPRDVEQRVKRLANVGWRVEEAHARRLELMAERSPASANGIAANQTYTFSLCEH